MALTFTQQEIVRSYAGKKECSFIASKAKCTPDQVRYFCRYHHLPILDHTVLAPDMKSMPGFSNYYINDKNQVFSGWMCSDLKQLRGRARNGSFVVRADDGSKPISVSIVRFRFCADHQVDPRDVTDKGFWVLDDGTLVERHEYLTRINERHVAAKAKRTETRTRAEQVKLLKESLDMQAAVIKFVEEENRPGLLLYLEQFWPETKAWLRKRGCSDLEIARDCFDAAVEYMIYDLFEGMHALAFGPYTLRTFTRRKYLEARKNKKRVLALSDALMNQAAVSSYN